MADRKGGKVAGDAGTKQDQPSADAGQVTDAETKQSTEAVGQEQAETKAAAPKPKPRKKAAKPEAEGTAAATTEVDKAAAEVVADAEAPAKPKRSRAKKADAPAEAATTAAADAPAAEATASEGEAPARPRRRRRGAGPETPAAPAGRPSRAAARTNGAAPVVRAQAKYVRTSARKARLVCDHIRGKSVDEARAILAFTPRAVARDWSKLLESAIANAENNHELVGDDLKVHAAFADEGPTLKRFQPRAMGRASRIRKRTSHLTIQLTPKEN
jgi:ribosomal protein L22